MCEEEERCYINVGSMKSPNELWIAPRDDVPEAEKQKQRNLNYKLAELFLKLEDEFDRVAEGDTVALRCRDSFKDQVFNASRALVLKKYNRERSLLLFQLDTGKEILSDGLSIRVLTNEVRKLSEDMKPAALTLTLLDLSMFAISRQNQDFAKVLLEMASQVWIEGLRTVNQKLFGFVYCCFDRIKPKLRQCLGRSQINFNKQGLKRVCLNSVLNENLSARNDSYLLKMDDLAGPGDENKDTSEGGEGSSLGLRLAEAGEESSSNEPDGGFTNGQLDDVQVVTDTGVAPSGGTTPDGGDHSAAQRQTFQIGSTIVYGPSVVKPTESSTTTTLGGKQTKIVAASSGTSSTFTRSILKPNHLPTVANVGAGAAGDETVEGKRRGRGRRRKDELEQGTTTTSTAAAAPTINVLKVAVHSQVIPPRVDALGKIVNQSYYVYGNFNSVFAALTAFPHVGQLELAPEASQQHVSDVIVQTEEVGVERGVKALNKKFLFFKKYFYSILWVSVKSFNFESKGKSSHVVVTQIQFSWREDNLTYDPKLATMNERSAEFPQEYTKGIYKNYNLLQEYNSIATDDHFKGLLKNYTLLQELLQAPYDVRIPKPNSDILPCSQILYTRLSARKTIEMLEESLGMLNVCRKKQFNKTATHYFINLNGFFYKVKYTKYVKILATGQELLVILIAFSHHDGWFECFEKDSAAENQLPAITDYTAKNPLNLNIDAEKDLPRHVCKVEIILSTPEESAKSRPAKTPSIVRRPFKHSLKKSAVTSNLGQAMINMRLKLMYKYESRTYRPTMGQLNSFLNGSDQAAGEAVEDANDPDEVNLLQNFSNWSSHQTSHMYSSRDGPGMVMVVSSNRLLSCMVASACKVNPSWEPCPLEIDIFQPKLTNGYILLTVYNLAAVTDEGHGRRKSFKKEKMGLGLVAFSNLKFEEEDATLVAEHMYLNNYNFCRIGALATGTPQLFEIMRNGLRAHQAGYVVDQANAINAATNKLKVIKQRLLEMEAIVSEELNVSQLSWETYAEKVIRPRQEADLADIIHSPFEGEEYVLLDVETRRQFCLTMYERALLAESELRRHEIDLLENLAYGTPTDVPWKTYVHNKVNKVEGHIERSMSFTEYLAWGKERNTNDVSTGLIERENTTVNFRQARKEKYQKRSVKTEKTRERRRIEKTMEVNVMIGESTDQSTVVEIPVGHEVVTTYELPIATHETLETDQAIATIQQVYEVVVDGRNQPSPRKKARFQIPHWNDC